MPTTLPSTPSLTLTLPPHASNPHFAGFSPDGQSLYFVADLEQFDPWSLLTHHWPELLVTLWTVLALRALLRTYFRKQDPTHDHCRRCNYSLHTLTTHTCPECGLALTPKNRTPGRHRRRKLALASLLLALPLLLYPLFSPRLPRTGPFTHWLDLRSPRLAAIAKRTNTRWLQRHVKIESHVLRADPATGRTSTLARLPVDSANHWVAATLADDGRSAFVLTITKDPQTPSRRHLAKYDLHTGRTLYALPNTWMPAQSDPPGLLFAEASVGHYIAADARTGAIVDQLSIVNLFGRVPVGNGIILVRADELRGMHFDLWQPRARRGLRRLCSAYAKAWCAYDGNLVLLRHNDPAGFAVEVRSLETGGPVDSFDATAPDELCNARRLTLVTRGRRLFLFARDLPHGTTGLAELDLPNRRLLNLGSVPDASPENISPDATHLLSNPTNRPLELYALPPPSAQSLE